MTTAVAPQRVAGSGSRFGAISIAPAVAVAAIASIGAGAIHAAAIGVHSEHRQAVIAFTVLAVLQLGWGVFALQRCGRVMAIAGTAINGAAVGGWILAMASGISFVDGLDVAEDPRFADTTAMVMAGIAVVAALASLFWHNPQAWFGSLAFTATAVVTAVITAFAMVAAGSHSHAAGGHSHGADATAAHSHAGGTASGGGSGGHAHTSGVVPPKEYDPDKPIDLGGVPGVSLKQQAQAENLIAITLLRLPKFSDYRVAEANGFRSIGDGLTGDEHFINTAYFDDGHILDPDRPESLVYDTRSGGRKLAAAMFMMAPGDSFDDIPDVGGPLTQWHIHNNLCFTTTGKVAGIVNNEGKCNAPLVHGPLTPMIHVWIEKNPCGPFAALEGIGGGQLKPGETRLCDHAHGGA